MATEILTKSKYGLYYIHMKALMRHENTHDTYENAHDTYESTHGTHYESTHDTYESTHDTCIWMHTWFIYESTHDKCSMDKNWLWNHPWCRDRSIHQALAWVMKDCEVWNGDTCSCTVKVIVLFILMSVLLALVRYFFTIASNLSLLSSLHFRFWLDLVLLSGQLLPIERAAQKHQQRAEEDR